jgi:hypothetical protein
MRTYLLMAPAIAWFYASSAIADPADFHGTQNLKVVTDFNFLTGSPNHWVASGAFADEGTIGHDLVEFFRGRVAKVTDSPEGQNGSFTWSFSQSFTASGGAYGEHSLLSSWKITGGTGKYAGITGQGTSQGTWNDVTGAIHGEATGKVDCPKC